MNVQTFNGRLGQDGELRFTPAGKAVMELSVAVSKKNGETWVTSWFKTILWDKTAEMWAPFCKKGSEVFVIGEPENKEWTDKEGKRRVSNQVTANFFRVCMSTRQPQQSDDDYGISM